MKFTANAKVLADAVTLCSKVVDTRTTFPILGNMMVTAKDGAVTLRATDLDIEITHVLKEAAVSENGETTIPARMFSDMLRKFDRGAEVSFEAQGADTAVIKSGRSRFQLQTLSPDSFPTLKTSDYLADFEVEGRVFGSALDATAFCISNEETRYYLNGIYMHYHQVEQKVRFIATDGHRMARVSRDIPGAEKMSSGIIIPKKTIREITTLCDLQGQGAVRVQINDTRICVTGGGTTVLSKLIEGTFPDYERVTPKNTNYTAEVDVDLLAKAVDRVSTMASERGGKALKMTFGSGTVELLVSNPDHGDASEDVNCSVDLENFQIGFNARYLNDCMSAIGKGEARFAFTDIGSPTLITGGDDPSLVLVLMPMRV